MLPAGILANLEGRLKAIHHWHLAIHQHQIIVIVPQFLQGLGTIIGHVCPQVHLLQQG